MLNHDPTGTRFSRSKVSPLASNPGVGWPTAFDPGRIAARHSAPTADTSLIRGTALALALLIEPASADTVIMRNGDRLTGEVLRQEGGELLIRTAYAGTIALDWGQVSDIRLDAPATVLLDDERVVTVAALTREKESLRFETPAGREPMTVSTNQVRVIQPEPWEMGDGGKFSGRINLALEDQTGNSVST